METSQTVCDIEQFGLCVSRNELAPIASGAERLSYGSESHPIAKNPIGNL